jgi:hypothetical protein
VARGSPPGCRPSLDSTCQVARREDTSTDIIAQQRIDLRRNENCRKKNGFFSKHTVRVAHRRVRNFGRRVVDGRCPSRVARRKQNGGDG